MYLPSNDNPKVFEKRQGYNPITKSQSNGKHSECISHAEWEKKITFKKSLTEFAFYDYFEEKRTNVFTQA